MKKKRCKLICNLVLPKDASRISHILRDLLQLKFGTGTPEEIDFGSLELLERQNTPDYSGWRNNIDWALKAFDATRLDKVVLARKATFSFSGSLSPSLLLHRLRTQTPECFHFLFQPSADTSFIGATPERLFQRIGRTIATEAVAGTRPRGTSPEEDAHLATDLLDSDKDRREQEYVRHSIAQAIAPFCTSFQQDQGRSVMKLAQRMHLCSRFKGTLQHGVSDRDLLSVLHPTPAVGGHPKKDAQRSIDSLEAFDRGWYAGPIGWVGADSAEFAVAIRSGLVKDHILSLYSGAGIVTGSTPEAEWEEIEQKISDFTRLLLPVQVQNR